MAPPVGFEKGALEGKSSPEDRRPTGQRSNSLRRSIHAATVMPLECVENMTAVLPKKMHVFLGVKGDDRKPSEHMSDIQQPERRRTSEIVN
jgi:hypothetical protein